MHLMDMHANIRVRTWLDVAVQQAMRVELRNGAQHRAHIAGHLRDSMTELDFHRLANNLSACSALLRKDVLHGCK